MSFIYSILAGRQRAHATVPDTITVVITAAATAVTTAIARPIENVRRRIAHTASIATMCVVFTTACEHPIEIVTPHAEAADLVIRELDSTLVARTVLNERWDGIITLAVNQERRLRVSLIDFKKVEFSLDERKDIEIRMEAEHGSLVQWEPWTGYGFLRGFAPGTTRVRFLVWHGSHPDFITPWLTLTVDPES